MNLTEQEQNKIKFILAVYIEALTSQYETNLREEQEELKKEIIACLRVLKKFIL